MFSIISVAISFAALNKSSSSCTDLTSPPSQASSAEKTLPEYVHSKALLIPTILGKNQLEAASGTRPLLAKTKPSLAFLLARRISIGRVIVTPTPTAGPLIAAITGLGQSKIASVVLPPPSLIHSKFS